VFNHSRFVAECIESVIAQSYQNIELIIIDDGSTDSSFAVVEQYLAACKARFRRFKAISRPNVGVSATLNEGLEWADGKYFCGLASDDLILPDKTRVLVEYLENHQSCVAAFGSVYMIDNDSRKIGKRVGNAVYNFKDVFLLRAELPAPAALIRREVLELVGGFDKDTKVEDWDIWLRVSKARDSAVAVIPDLLANYRVHSTNTWKNIDAMHSAKMEIIQKYSNDENYDRAQAVLECALFRDLSIARKKEALRVFFSIFRRVQVYREIRFYQGVFYLFFRWK
jgi:alpha-1,3-rhamnosyltransferase